MERGTCHYCGARTKAPAKGLPPLTRCVRCTKRLARLIADMKAAIERQDAATERMRHENDVLGYYNGHPIRGAQEGLSFMDAVSEPSGADIWNYFDPIPGRHYATITPVGAAVRTGPCKHKWTPWKASGGRFDAKGPIETSYSRACLYCREVEETRTADRL